MKQAWEDLGSEYEASSSVLIGDVDCTVHSGVCSKHGVQGYPTIKYYKDGDKEGQSYNGGRTIDAMKTFTADTLEVKCQVSDPSGCSDKEKKFIDTMKVSLSGCALENEHVLLRSAPSLSSRLCLKFARHGCVHRCLGAVLLPM